MGKDTKPPLVITIQLGPLKDRGRFSSLLTVAFPNERTLTLPVIANIVAPVVVRPNTLVYAAAVPGTQSSLECTLSAETPFKVLEVTAPTVLTVMNINNTDKLNQKRLKVIWNVPNASTALQEEIQVLTTVDPLPIHIPVYGFIQNR